MKPGYLFGTGIPPAQLRDAPPPIADACVGRSLGPNLKNRTPHENRVRGQLAIASRWGNTEAAERARAELRAIKARKLLDQANALLRENDEGSS